MLKSEHEKRNIVATFFAACYVKMSILRHGMAFMRLMKQVLI